MIRVILPFHLRTLARTENPVEVSVRGAVTTDSIIDALENRFPALRGTIRDYGTGARRPYLRYFVCEEDISHQSPHQPLPEPVARGAEPFLILGAIAGG